MISSHWTRSVVLCLVFLLPVCVIAQWNHTGEQWLQQLTSDFATAQRRLQQKHPFIEIAYTPGADPAMVCAEFTKAVNSTPECSCDIAPDNSVSLKCLDIEETCLPGFPFCYLQTVNIALTPIDNKIKSIESCTNYEADLSKFSESTTRFANYSAIVPCVKVIPAAVNDFSTLASCSATVNGAACHKCELCNAYAPSPGISLDCCNTNPDGEQLKVNCGPVSGGAFAPFFESYEEGSMEKCASGASDDGLGGRMNGLRMVVAAMVVGFSSLVF